VVRTAIHGATRAGAGDRRGAGAIGMLAGLTGRRNGSKGRVLRKLTHALVLVGALVLALAVPALAAEPASNGASAINTEYCQSFGSQTYCARAKGMANVVVTPSGNESYVAIYRQEAWMTANGQVVWQSSRAERLHSLTIDGVEQQMSQAASYEIPLFGQTFCGQFHVQFANGEYQFFRTEFQPCG
jgi:hypothetical protein